MRNDEQLANRSQPLYATIEVLSYIVRRCAEKSVPVNGTKVQKLLYCRYGVVFAAFGIKLIDEFPVLGCEAQYSRRHCRRLNFSGSTSSAERKRRLSIAPTPTFFG